MAPTIALIITGQLALAVAVDHFGILEVAVHPIDPTRLAGLGALVLGTFLIVRG